MTQIAKIDSINPDLFGAIPQSDALAEASPLSLQEEFSRDPEHYQSQNIDYIIQTLQDLKRKFQESGPSVKQPKVSYPKTTVSFEDLGLKF